MGRRYRRLRHAQQSWGHPQDCGYPVRVSKFEFPDLRLYPDAPEAFLGEELDRTWLLAAYARGFFPWPDEDEQLIWCNPAERMVFDPGVWKGPKRLHRILRQGHFSFVLDGDFEGVLHGCRTVAREGGTWITDELTGFFQDLFEEGLAHCIGVYQGEQLVGGLYGLSLGNAFFGESMFSRVPNASKAGLTVLLSYLDSQGLDLFDAQVENPHLVKLKGRLEPREEYLDRLEASLKAAPNRLGPWTLPEFFLDRTLFGNGMQS